MGMRVIAYFLTPIGFAKKNHKCYSIIVLILIIYLMAHTSYIEDVDKAYVSEYDHFLRAFDKEHPIKSSSQQAEINKHRRIAEKRDNPLSSCDSEPLI